MSDATVVDDGPGYLVLRPSRVFFLDICRSLSLIWTGHEAACVEWSRTLVVLRREESTEHIQYAIQQKAALASSDKPVTVRSPC